MLHGGLQPAGVVENERSVKTSPLPLQDEVSHVSWSGPMHPVDRMQAPHPEAAVSMTPHRPPKLSLLSGSNRKKPDIFAARKLWRHRLSFSATTSVEHRHCGAALESPTSPFCAKFRLAKHNKREMILKRDRIRCVGRLQVVDVAGQWRRPDKGGTIPVAISRLSDDGLPRLRRDLETDRGGESKCCVRLAELDAAS